MKNNYRIRGDFVEIELHSSKWGSHITKISLSDLPILLAKNNTWRPIKYTNSNTIYVIGFDKKVNGCSKTVSLHRYLLKPDDKELVDHISGDGLDNTRENLRIACGKVNMRNRNKINKNNTLNESNVTFVKDKNVFRVGFMEDRRFIFFGYFDELESAKKARDYVRSLIDEEPLFNLYENKKWIRERVKWM